MNKAAIKFVAQVGIAMVFASITCQIIHLNDINSF